MSPNRARSLRTLLCAVAVPLVLPFTGVACSSEDEDRGVDVQDGRKGKGGGGGTEAEGGSSTGGTTGTGKGGASASGGASAGKGGTGGGGSDAGGKGGGDAGTSAKGGTGGKAGNGGSTTAGAAGSGGGMGGSGGANAGKGGAAGSATLASNHLSIVKPTQGQIFVQSGSPAKVDIPYEVLAGADIASVEYVIETDFSLGTSKAAPNFPLTYPYQYPGDRITEARGFDASGNQIASAYIDFVIQGPGGSGTGGSGGAGGSPSTGKCLTDLDALGVSYTPTKARGVVDAVKLTGPLNGVRYAKTDTDAISTDPMACEFVKTLYEFATVLKAHGFTKIGGLGAYCYRCCCSWSETNYCRGVDDPEPSCGSNGYSNHSFGRALDIRYLYKADGTRYDVNDVKHFVKFADEDHTCTTALAAQTGISKELYELVCDASAKKVFGSILTPNHNAAHRNHFHCDIGKSGTPSGYAVKDAPWSWGTRVDGPGDEGEDE